jgi:isopenicillin N synthase-like dioxygenase
MKMTYYPPCRQVDKVIGLSPHTDACAVTLLLHVNDVQGLQIRRDDGKWHAVEPLHGALIVSVGDIIEASIVLVPSKKNFGFVVCFG